MVKKVAIGLGGLVLVGIIAVGIYLYNLTAPVEVSDKLPVAATLSVSTPTAVPSTPVAAPTATAVSVLSTAPALTTAASSPLASATRAAPTAAATTAASSNPAASTQQVYRIDATKSKASYEVREVFINENNRLFTAVGTTSAVAGDILLDQKNPTASKVGEIVVDISQLKSDDSQRDNAIRRQWLESARYPKAIFKNATISGLPATLPQNAEFSFKITGDMTVRTTTQPVTWEVKARLEGTTLRVQASTNLKMSSFGVRPPDLAGFLKAEDNLLLKLDLVLSAVNSAN